MVTIDVIVWFEKLVNLISIPFAVNGKCYYVELLQLS